MKKIFFFLSITFLMLQSCSSGDSKDNPGGTTLNEGPLLKKITYPNGTTINFQYDGNKLSKATSPDGGSMTFIYDGNLITQINSPGFVRNFYYSNNDLIRATWVDEDGSSGQTNYVYYPGGKVTVNSKTTYFYSNGNISNIESNGELESYTYDTKNSPWRNISGLLKLNAEFSFGGDNIFFTTNNILTILNPTRSNSRSPINFSYQYNSQGYPISCTQTQEGGQSFTLNYSYYTSEIPSDETTTYPSITIGTQVWMQKNLDVSKYRNGDQIPQVQDPVQWANLTTGAWCYYENNTANGTTYGKLYNWYAVNDPRGLAPEEWHIPSKDEWTILINYLGGENVAGGKMKATTLWTSPNAGATNSSGFTGLPGGLRNDDGKFSSLGYSGVWWSGKEYNSQSAWTSSLYCYDSSVTREDDEKREGYSVRCVKK